MILTISEIVSSIQGEGKFTGYPTTFVRLFGCNLKCNYCDSMYANDGKRKRMSVKTVLEYIFKMGNQHVCITGGEPLLQESIYCLIYDLVDRGINVTIETNGAVELEEYLFKRSFSYCMDIKTPSSGMSNKNIYDNLGRLLANDEVKFVIKDINDYLFAKDILRKYSTKASIIFSPCFINGVSNAKDIADWLVEDKIANTRLGVQLHRLVGFY